MKKIKKQAKKQNRQETTENYEIQAEALKRRKEIYEAKYPEAKKDSSERMKKIRRGDKLSLCQKSFTEDTANKIGLSQRTIQRDIQIAEKIDSQVKDKIRNTEQADNKKELLLLARLGENILIEVKIEGSVETKPRNKIETI